MSDPWAHIAKLAEANRQKAARAEKAVVSVNPWANSIPLSSLANTPQEKAATHLKAYKVGWFFKAGRKIANDVASLDWSLSLGDAEEGDQEEVLDRPDLTVPFDSLSPIDQFQRLMERPNPNQTGRQLMHKTQVRLDFAGAAALYLENGTSGLPTAVYGISPARMWPSYDKAGNLIGWIMDYNERGGGTPFDKAEILWLTTGNADNDDIWGVSVVEAVYAQVPLTDAMARHTANVLTMGGRLAGMMWPKERALGESEYIDAQRAWRNVASDPNAGKRLLIFPEPMEYAAGASTPAEIGIPELAILNRDEIVTAFPISPYMLGVPTPGGLNSGEVRREDRRDYWEGTIHPRADLIEEAIQVGLLSRYETVMGQTYDYEIAEPNLDDAASIETKVKALRSLAAAGFDEREAVKAVGLDHIKFTGIPEPPPVPAAPPVPPPMAPPVPPPARKSRAEEERDGVVESAATRARKSLMAFFREQQTRVAERVHALPAQKAARAAVKDAPWWDADAEDRALTEAMRSIYIEVGRGGLQTVSDTLDRIVANRMVSNVIADLLVYGGERIKGINERTLQALTIELAEGTRRGYSITQLVEGVPEEGYRGVMGVALENGTPAFGELRAETIARTETMLSYNRATITSYGEFGVEQLLAYDGVDDHECEVRNGETYSIEDALAEEDHPNGTLVWSPVVDKAQHDEAYDLATKAIEALSRPQPDIHVHTTPPDVILPTPIVNVEAQDVTPFVHAIESLSSEVKALRDTPPVVNVPAPIVNVPSPIVTVKAPQVTDVRVTAMPDRAHRLQRDKQGKPTGSVETDA